QHRGVEQDHRFARARLYLNFWSNSMVPKALRAFSRPRRLMYSSSASLTVARFVRWRPARSARSRSLWSIARFVAMVPSWILHTLLHNLRADKRLSAGLTCGTMAGIFERA